MSNYDQMFFRAPDFEAQARKQQSAAEKEAVEKLLSALQFFRKQNAVMPATIENFLSKLSLERGSRTVVNDWLESKRIGGRRI
jgi:hypothetical protein